MIRRKRWRRSRRLDVPNNNIHLTSTAAAVAPLLTALASRRTQRSRARTRTSTITGFYTAVAAAAAADITRLKFFSTVLTPHYRRPHRRRLTAQPITVTTAAADRNHRSAHSVTHTQNTVHRHRSDGAGKEAVILISEY